MIGRGSFGKVYLVEEKTTGKLFAMKALRKDLIIDTDQFDCIKLEKQILFTVNHPFIVQMEYVFQNEYRIYFLMEFVAGGELFRHQIKVRRFKEDQARFIGA